MGNQFFGIDPDEAEEKCNKNCSVCGGVEGDMPGMVDIGSTQDDTLWGPCPKCFSKKLAQQGREESAGLTCKIGF